MNIFVNLFLRLWNLSPRLVSGMVQRSSTTNLVQNPSDLTQEELVSQNRWPTWRFVLYAYLGFAVVRFWAAAIVLATGGQFLELQQYDVLMSINMNVNVVNFYAAICFSPLTLFIIHYDWTVYVKRFNSVIRLCHEVIVVNPRHFLALNPQFKPALSFNQNLLCSLRSSFRRLSLLGAKRPQSVVRTVQWSVPVLPYFSYISVTIRRRALLLTWFFQAFISFFLTGTGSFQICLTKFNIFTKNHFLSSSSPHHRRLLLLQLLSPAQHSPTWRFLDAKVSHWLN